MVESLPLEGRRRVVIENVRPRVDDGYFPVKRIVHDPVTIEVDIFADGHDLLLCRLRYRADEKESWRETALESRGNDLWVAPLTIDRVGRWQFQIVAWADRFATWRYELTKRAAAGQDLTVEMLIGAELVRSAGVRAQVEKQTQPAAWLQSQAALLAADTPIAERVEAALNPALEEALLKHADRSWATQSAVYEIQVDRPKARFSAWYELFPRSTGAPGTHGTLRDVAARIPYIAELGFDVLYMPPIHPIGTAFRKGKNNAVTAQPDDVGSPWGIGGEEGGHDALHPQLGTWDDFEYLRVTAEQRGIELALDLAYQCSPDHPYVTEHPYWFRQRPDGTIQYAENPPKKYQDIYPFDFESVDWRGMWVELRRVIEFWIERGVRIFRVDNPHTKAFPFWEWCIRDVKTNHPDVLFLSEAFTRPKVRYRLAKLGYSQSYTYFTWRNTKAELTEYLLELTRPPVNQFFRHNLWPNTPDILHASLQNGGRAAFKFRVVLAATLGANYGLYGPAYELCVNTPREPGSEEYHDSEKYEIREWDWDSPTSLKSWITAINRARHANPALQRDDTLQFHPISDDNLLAYTKASPDGANVVLVVVNLDPQGTHAGELTLRRELLPRDLPPEYRVQDQLSGRFFDWSGLTAFIELTPDQPAHLFVLP